MKPLVLLFACTLSLGTFAQKVAVEKGLVMVDGLPYCNLTEVDCKLAPCDYHVSTLDNKEFLMVKALNYDDNDKKSEANPTGRVSYFEWTFLTSGEKTETDPLSEKDMAKAMVEASLLKDGVPDRSGERKFIASKGTSYSTRAQQLGVTPRGVEK